MRRTPIIPIEWVPDDHDSDWDGVPNYRDCEPFNPRKQDTNNQKLKDLYKNRKQIMNTILKAYDKHGDTSSKLYDYAMSNPSIWISKTFNEKKNIIKKIYPYLTRRQIDFIAYSHKMEKKYGPIPDDWDD